MTTNPTTYRRLFVDPASPLLWGRGSTAFPRNRDCLFVNTQVHLKQGYQYRRGRFVKPLQRFSGGSLRYHLTRAKGEYLLTTFEDFVCFIPFDIDCHPKPIGCRETTLLCDPDELDELRHAFLKRCQEVHGIFQSLGLKVIWYTSPGNIYNNKHVQGVNGVILLDKPEMRQQLAECCRALVERHGLQDVEFHWLTGNLFRLPFQRHMCVCDPETLEPLYPSNPSCRYWEFVTGCHHLNEMVETGELTDIGILAREWRIWRQEQMRRFHSPAETVQAMPSVATVTPAASKRVRIAKPANEALLSMPNTFKAATDGRICSGLTIRYRGNWQHFETAVQEAKAELKRIRPTPSNNPFRLPVSNTCTDTHLLDRTVRRWLKWYFTCFDPQKTNPKPSARDEEDKQRFSRFRSLDTELLTRVIGRQLSYDDTSQFLEFWRLARKWNGRVAAKAIYDAPDALFTKANWFALKAKIKNLVQGIDAEDAPAHKCRQWGLTETAMAMIGEQGRLAQNAATILEEKKEETVYGTTAHAMLTSDAFVMTQTLAAAFAATVERDWGSLEPETLN